MMPRTARRSVLTRLGVGLGVSALLLAAAIAPVLPSAWAGGTIAAGQPITIFAAASTTNAVDEIAALYEAEGNGAVRPVFAASSTLAKQIEQGAPADLYLSANVGWMDYLAERGLLAAGSRVSLLGNSLVLIAPAGSAPLLDVGSIEVKPGFALAAAIGDGRLAIGDPAHVPAGIYAKAALETLGVWDQVAPKAAPAANVRAALALVESGAAVAGIVYGSDAAISDRVRVVATFPPDSHPPIAYPLAIMTGHERPEVARFRDFLLGPRAAEIFSRHGFVPLAEQPQG